MSTFITLMQTAMIHVLLQIDFFSNITNAIKKNIGPAIIFVNAVIVFLAIFFLIKPVSKAYGEFSNGNFGQGAKYLAACAIIIIVAIGGISLVLSIGKEFGPKAPGGSNADTFRSLPAITRPITSFK